MDYPQLTIQPTVGPAPPGYTVFGMQVKRVVETLPPYFKRLAGYRQAKAEIAYDASDLSANARDYYNESMAAKAKDGKPHAIHGLYSANNDFMAIGVFKAKTVNTGQDKVLTTSFGQIHHEFGHMLDHLLYAEKLDQKLKNIRYGGNELRERMGYGITPKTEENKSYTGFTIKAPSESDWFKKAVDEDTKTVRTASSYSEIFAELNRTQWGNKNNEPNKQERELIERYQAKYPTTMRAIEKLHSGLAELSEKNPDDVKFRTAVVGYLNELDGKQPSKANTISHNLRF